MSSNETIKTQQQQVEVKQEMDDESDSCFAARKPVAQLFKRSSDQSDNCAHVKSPHLASLTSPPVIINKLAKSSSSISQIPNVKSVQTTANSSNLDKIANNLKSKQQTIKKKESQNIPKVTLVSKVNQLQSKPTARTIYNDELLNKAYAHKLILHQLRKQQENNELNEDLDDDLTNLSWLTTFNLSNLINTPNSLTLSPPKSPSSAPSSPSSNSLLNSTLDDEADCNAFHPKRDAKFSNQLLASILALNHLDDAHKPPFTFSCLIFLAIESAERKRLSVKDIYSWISQTFVYYHNVPSGSWKNSIRHNLALNKSFAKVDKNLLAMRDFSGKGSLWCIDAKVRTALLDLFQKCSLAHNLDELNKCALLADVHETALKQHHQQFRQHTETSKTNSKIKIKPIKTSNLFPTKPIINPQLVAKLQNVPKITHVLSSCRPFSKSNSFNHAKKTTGVATTSPPLVEACSELDAVNALLSMKSKATSMPSISTGEGESSPASKNRRKQMLKQPTKKCEDDEEDEEVDVEEDYFIDEENDDDEEFDESYSTQENEKSINVNDFTDDDEEEEEENDEDADDENGRLKIDESEVNSKKDANNLLLELSRAAVLVETEKDDEPSKKKLKINKSL